MASALVMSSAQMAFAKTGKEDISVHYNGIVVTVAGSYYGVIITQKEPFIHENMVYVPIRTVSEELGHKVTWDDSISTVYLELNDMVRFEERKITKDSFYGLEYEVPKGGELLEPSSSIERWIWFGDRSIVLSFYPDSNEFSSVETILIDLTEEDDSLSEEYTVMEREIKTQAGTIFVYLELHGKYTEDEIVKEFDEFMDKTVFRTGQERIQVAYKDIKIISNGKEVSMEREPFIHNGTIYLAVRDLAKALNKEVEWDRWYSAIDIKDKPDMGEKVKRKNIINLN